MTASLVAPAATVLPATAIDGEVVAALHRLRDVVAMHGYDTIHRLHCYELAPRGLEVSLRQTLGSLPVPTRDLLQLFYFGDTLPAARVERIFGDEGSTQLRRAGLLVARAGHDALAARHRLEVIRDHLLLVDWPQDRAARVYFGEDSEFLRSVLRPRRGDVALDLCTGSGVQGLRCAEVAAHVDAVDLNPAAAQLARWNAELNDLGERVSVVAGDLWEPLPPRARWDYVVSNPPLIPVPDTVPYPLCGHGGADGLSVVRRILEQLPERLTPQGRCMLIGASIGSRARPAVLEAIERTVASEMQTTLYLLTCASLRDWVSMIARTMRAVSPGGDAGNTVLRARAEYGAAFEESVVYTFLVVCARGRMPVGCRVVDYSGFGQQSFWFVNRRPERRAASASERNR